MENLISRETAINRIGEEDGEITLKLKKRQIPLLLGAARLGTLVQDWCFELWCANAGSIYDLPMSWVLAVRKTIAEIKKQTNINNEDEGCLVELETIENLVADQCKKYETESILQWNEEEGKQLAIEKARSEGVIDKEK